MRRCSWLLLVLAMVCVGCGVRPSGAIPGDPAPTGPVNGVTLFLVRNDQLVPTLRTTLTQLTPIAAISVLAEGPDSDEQGQGLRTQVPANLAPAGVNTTAAGTTLDIGIDPTTLSTTAIEQLVCTALSAISAQTTATIGNVGVFSIAGAGRTMDALRCPEIG
ncbi:MAG TPA: hypothetical protein VHZ97_12960 [Pseudonocardiaceae bacterium]|jgi:hypothetical protein|nr:hypothetical protein [Pseudonocardiaceae bacterium]